MANDKEYEHLPREFHFQKSVKTKTGIKRVSNDCIKARKKKVPMLQKKNTTDINTVALYMKEIGPQNVKVENLPAAELDHLLCKFFMNICKKNGREYEPDSISGFSAKYPKIFEQHSRILTDMSRNAG